MCNLLYKPQQYPKTAIVKVLVKVLKYATKTLQMDCRNKVKKAQCLKYKIAIWRTPVCEEYEQASVTMLKIGLQRRILQQSECNHHSLL